MSDYRHKYRLIARWRLAQEMPRVNRLVGHLPAKRGMGTQCGQDGGPMVLTHVTVARALAADDCKSCHR